MNLKVCQLLPRLLLGESGTIIGAAATNCLSLAMALRRQGVNITVLAPVSKETLGALAHCHLSEIVRPVADGQMGLMGRGLGAIWALHRGLKGILSEDHFDVVHSHSGTYPYAILPLAADRKASVRLHSLYCPLDAKGGVFSRWWERPAIARMLFNRLDRVVAVTDNVRRSIEEAGVRPEKIESIAMCVDTRRFYPREKKGPSRYFPEDRGRIRILFIGNASREKGLREILEAVRILREKRVSVFLVAAVENQCGIGEYTVRFRQAREFIHEAGIENLVRLVGLVDTIEDLYVESDIVVSPWSTSRGPSDCPMVVLEAMAMGKCIVSTPVGGCPELLTGGAAGILTKDFSAESVACAIASVVHDPQARRRIEQAAVGRAADFSLRATTDHLIHLYERLLESKRQRDA